MRKLGKIFWLILVFSCVGFIERAYADACATALMPAFTPGQAYTLCTKFGTSVAASIIPQTDNTYDLGSTSKTFRTLYTGTSRIAKTSDILRVRQDAQRLFTWDGSSDTALTETFGDAGTTAVQKFTISASTADADDDSTVIISGGGAYASDGSRGGSITIPGEEVSGGSDITYQAGSGDTHLFQTGSTQTMLISSTGLVTSAAGFTATAGDFIAAPAASGLVVGEAARAANVTTALNAVAPANYASMDASLGGGVALVGFGAAASGIQQAFFKTRAASSGAGSTIVSNGDVLGLTQYWGSNGTGYTLGASITASVSATPGASADMPSSLNFKLSPDGSGTPASVLLLDQDKSALFTGTVRSSATGSIGWSVGAAANQACNTTCTSACVIGIDTLGTGGFLDCATATSDFCICAGTS